MYVVTKICNELYIIGNNEQCVGIRLNVSWVLCNNTGQVFPYSISNSNRQHQVYYVVQLVHCAVACAGVGGRVTFIKRILDRSLVLCWMKNHKKIEKGYFFHNAHMAICTRSQTIFFYQEKKRGGEAHQYFILSLEMHPFSVTRALSYLGASIFSNRRSENDFYLPSS